MSDIVWAAIIGVGGSVLVAIVSVITQLLITKNVINSDKEKILITEKAKSIEKRKEQIIDLISELLVTSDPQSSIGVDYGRTTNLISKTQLLLDYNVVDELALNKSLNNLGISLQNYYPLRLEHINNKTSETEKLLNAHGSVIEKTQNFLKGLDKHYSKGLKN